MDRGVFVRVEELEWLELDPSEASEITVEGDRAIEIDLSSTTEIDLAFEGGTTYPGLRRTPRYLREPAVIDLTPEEESLPEPSRGFYARYGKRAFDIALVLALAPIWLAAYLAIAVLVLLFDGRPVHFASPRPGYRLGEFKILKFRTMARDADEVLDRLLAEGGHLAEEFKLSAKLRHDPRITRLGNRLRRMSLDELPQLFNVLTGQMSLVGPRPPASWDELDALYGASARLTMQTRPGLTGLWQVTRGDEIRYDDRIRLDIEYVSTCTFVRDLKILIRTIPTIWRGHGAF